ncbi:GntR family transcriptional regulator [Acuticoccus sp. MNP-M23]|uniref:GntR family transcriptional regulator n=1 Tax=Acuticoccus sp. MNP-M23 TaxID=3072793 RepID=UPI00281556E5|nr:GntR family transcriptional regulator [Acuticoccus sp. MNP-M23]WMS44670.1 GntR family transcriptional regulator [Acuticoccus sp. MNP-M23]
MAGLARTGAADAGEIGDDPRRNREDLALDIARLLEEDIVFGRLHPRERLVEEAIAARFEVKRHVVRQAIVELERLGLVDRLRNKGAVVRVYTEKEVDDINTVRELLESEAASCIALPLSPASIAELEDIQREHSAAVEAHDRRGVFRCNIAFHKALFAHCGNAALAEAINIFAQKSHAYRSIAVSDRTYQAWAASAHWEMIDAIRNEDRPRLVALCKAHLGPSKNHYIETLRARYG